MRYPLTQKQVAIVRPLYEAKLNAEKQWQAALILLGLESAEITGGDLGSSIPYLLTSENDATQTSFVGEG